GKTTNTATINGNFTFNASSTNSGTVNGNAILNASSTNTGTITGTATFNMYTASSGAVTFSDTTAFVGTGYVTGNIYDSTSTQITSWIFNASSTNTGILKGNAVFNNTSSNIVTGTVQGNAIFNDTSTNLGTVTGNSDVYSPVTRPLGGTTDGQIIYHDYAGLYFNDSAIGHGVVGKWDDINNWWTNASSTVHSPVIPTAGDNAVILSGNIGTSSITATVNTITFQGTTNNGIDIYLTSTSTDAALFNASSTNTGTIHGNATFTGPDSDTSGTVTGYITRQYNAEVFVVLRDFTHNGGLWIVQAINGASVDLSGATYSLINNAFQALNNGFFSAWNSLIGGGASGNPNLVITSPTAGTNIKWKPVVSWDTSTLCQYKIDSGSYTSVICANNGSDIPKPSATSHIIFFKSTNGNNITEKSVSFTYDNTQPIDTDCTQPLDEATRPYYYLTANVGNCTITASTTLRGDDGLGHFYTMGNITGSSTNVSFINLTATGTISSFNDITVASSTLSGSIDVIGTFESDTLSRFGNTTIESGGAVNSGTFVGTLLNKSGGTIRNGTTSPVTVALSTTNNSVITGGFIFNATSTNTGTVTGTTTLNGTSINQNIINGNVTINDSALNSGTINGDLTFGGLLSAYDAVTFSGSTSFLGTNIVSGNIKDYQGNIITKWIFNDSSANTGSTKGDSFFNGTSTNAGTVSGNAFFNDSSINAGTVTGNADVYYSVTVPLANAISVAGSITYHSYPNSDSFQNISGDNSWSNLSNWFTDTTFSIPLGRTPMTNENIVLFASTTLPTDMTNNIFIAVSNTTLNGTGHTINGNISGDGAYGGHNAYNFNLSNITVTGTTSAIGGNGVPGLDGGKGGIIMIDTASTWVVSVNGGDPQQNGGDAGSATITNSFAVIDGTPITAIGGDSTGCGYGGSGGNISLIDSSGYVLITDTGADQTVIGPGLCAAPPTGSHGSHGTTVISGTYHAQQSPQQTTATVPATRSSSVSPLYESLLNSLTLPVNLLKPLKLVTLPVFGTTGAKGTFSFIAPITNFLFTPISFTLTPEIKSLLATHNISSTQDLISLRTKPLAVPVPPPAGLFIISTPNISVKTSLQKTTASTSTIIKTTLSSDSTHNLLQLVRVLPNTKLTITLAGATTGKWNGQTITFTNGSATITVPKKVGRYYLTTTNSSVPLAIEVKITKEVIVSTPAPVSTNPIVNIITNITNWFGGWFNSWFK
ncbi:MAG: hypothetical protein WCV55_01915, partial [Candidatus Paceibacterota bacterium]